MADSTRIDKFLWSIRVFKTRADATEACKGGKVTVNGQDAKPSKEVKGGDVVSVRKGAIHYTYKVLLPIEKRQGAKEVEKYAQNLTPESEIKKMKALDQSYMGQYKKSLEEMLKEIEVEEEENKNEVL